MERHLGQDECCLLDSLAQNQNNRMHKSMHQSPCLKCLGQTMGIEHELI